MAEHLDQPARFKQHCDEVLRDFKGVESKERDEILRQARRLVQELQTPVEYAQRMVWAPIELATAAAACEMGIFKVLSKHEGPTTVAEIAHSAKGNDTNLVQRIVQSLAAHGMVSQIDDTHYQANGITHDFTTPGRIGSVYTQMFCMPAFANLHLMLRDNGYQTPEDGRHTAWQRARGGETTMWEWMKQEPEMGQYFNDWMTTVRPHASDDLAKLYPFDRLFEGSKPEETIFVDVAGGLGHQCLNLRKTFSRDHGRMILQDLLHVVEGLELDGVEVLAHDMMKKQPVKEARAYYFRSVLHDHSDDVCRNILGRIVEAMGPSSRLLVHDALIEDFIPSVQTVRMDLGMMSQFAGRERTAAQMKALLESVGLKVTGSYKPGPEKWSITEAML